MKTAIIHLRTITVLHHVFGIPNPSLTIDESMNKDIRLSPEIHYKYSKNSAARS